MSLKINLAWLTGFINKLAIHLSNWCFCAIYIYLCYLKHIQYIANSKRNVFDFPMSQSMLTASGLILTCRNENLVHIIRLWTETSSDDADRIVDGVNCYDYRYLFEELVRSKREFDPTVVIWKCPFWIFPLLIFSQS